MSLFTMFSYKRREPHTLGAVMNDLTAAAHVQPGHVTYHSATLGDLTVHLHSLAVPGALYTERDQVHVGAELLAFNGYAFRPGVGAPTPLTAAGLAERFSIERCDELAGDYALAHASRDGEITALSDLHRVQSVYYVDTPAVFAVSTRPSLLALLAGETRFNPDVFAAITAMGYGLGSDTIFDGVTAVPQGTALIWDGSRTRLVDRDAVTRSDPGGGLSKVSDDELEQGIRAAAQVVELAAGDRETIDLGITGGKDSRLTLAFCLAGGLGPRLRLFTRGAPNHPDVLVGQRLAELVGLPHRVDTPASPMAGGVELSAGEYLSKVATAAFQSDGLVGAWDPFMGSQTSRRASLNGLMGELLKAFAKRDFDATLRPGAAELVRLQSPFDPMGILRPRRFRRLEETLNERFDQHVAAGRGFADLPDLFYLENRIPNWLGHSKQVHSFTETQFSPLGVPALTRLAFRARADERKAEVLHYRLLGKAAPELVDVPFAMQTWDSTLPVRQLPAVRLPESAQGVRMHGSWQYAVNSDPVRAAVRDLVARADAESVWSAVDKDALLRRLDGPPLAMKEIISLLGLVSVLLFSTGQAIPSKLEAPGSALPLVAYPSDRLPFPQRGVAT